MALHVRPSLPRARPAVAYRRILVPVLDNGSSAHATATGAELAAESGAVVTAVSVIEVPAELPLDAQMVDAQRRARRALSGAVAIAEARGVRVDAKVIRARAAAEAIVAEAVEAMTELIVLVAARKRGAGGHPPFHGSTAEFVLKHAPCRVLVCLPALRE